MKSTLPLLAAFSIAVHAQTVLVKPYVQPGNGAALTGTDVAVGDLASDNPEQKAIAFQISRRRA